MNSKTAILLAALFIAACTPQNDINDNFTSPDDTGEDRISNNYAEMIEELDEAQENLSDIKSQVNLTVIETIEEDAELIESAIPE